jgi:hypothetical protein
MINVIPHPHRGLMAEAKHEREVADSLEAEKLKDAIFSAVAAYSEFLEQQGVIWDDDADPDDPIPRLKAEALVVYRVLRRALRHHRHHVEKWCLRSRIRERCQPRLRRPRPFRHSTQASGG